MTIRAKEWNSTPNFRLRCLRGRVRRKRAKACPTVGRGNGLTNGLTNGLGFVIHIGYRVPRAPADRAGRPVPVYTVRVDAGSPDGVVMFADHDQQVRRTPDAEGR